MAINKRFELPIHGDQGDLISSSSAVLEPGNIFDMHPTKVAPLRTRWPVEWAFPGSVTLGQARGRSSGERVAFVIHGLAMNEDYFGLLAEDLLARDYQVWAIRLPGYVAAGQETGLCLPLHFGLSPTFYGWVIASAMSHVTRQLSPPPRQTLAWGHSLGAVALASAIETFTGPEWAGADCLAFEAPAFSEALAFPATMLALFTALPNFMLNAFARAFLLDDLHSSPFARKQGLPFVPGRASRLMLTMNLGGLANPLNRTPRLPAQFLSRSRFLIAKFDRLVDHDRLVQLLDGWGATHEQRLVIPRNHFLSLTSSHHMLEWMEASGGLGTFDGRTA